MAKWTRRDILKTGIVASAGATVPWPAIGRVDDNQQKGTSTDPPPFKVDGPPSPRKQELLDFGWRFHLGHADDPEKDFGFDGDIFAKSGNFAAPARANFDDSAWQSVDLPHDWVVELPFENQKGLTDHGFKPIGRKFPATSVGWYRKAFDIPKEDLGKRISIVFDGVYRNSIVVFNGHYLGENLSGYAPFRFDVTDFVNYGGKNILVVRADATESEGWFYEGAGIYRHVWLVTTSPVHVAHWGTFVRSEVKESAATVTITVEVENDSDSTRQCSVVSAFFDDNKRTLIEYRTPPVEVPAWGKREFEQQVVLKKPRLWSIEEPNLYQVVTSVLERGHDVKTTYLLVDRYETTFGIRTIHFDADKGFFLNGKSVKIKGTCNHQDHAGVGSGLPDRIQYFRIEKLKEMGSNAYRTSHNPPTPELLDACDKLGMLVMDETRMMSSNPEGLSQLERLVRRDRNHPSVFIWSLGNEEREQGTDRGARIVTTMKRLVKSIDPTRPVTVAMNGRWGTGVSAVLDVQGCNYYDREIDAFHSKFPQQPMIGSETASTVSTRGVYENDKEKGYVSAYDVNRPSWGATAETWWKIYDERPFQAGGFVWTGFDYRGEPTPYAWPCINSHFGIMDTCGFPKDNYYYYQAWWKESPTLHIFPHWNWRGKEGKEIEVWCHSNYDEVELFLNTNSLGKQSAQKNTHLVWKVKYSPGTLMAIGFKGGKEVEIERVETTDGPASITLTPDRAAIDANAEDVAMVTVSVVDAHGRVVPIADNEISFDVSANARIIGVGNGDPSSHEPDKASKRKVFNGYAQVIVQTRRESGKIVLSAKSDGLQSAQLIIEAKPAAPRPAIL